MPISRRLFLSGIASSLGLMSSVVWGKGKTDGHGAIEGPGPRSEMEGVSVFNEWDRLRTVIVGRGDDSMFPLTPAATMEEVLEKPQPNPYLPPELEDALIVQLNALAALLEALGVRVIRPRLLSAKEKDYLNHIETGGGLIFMRDPLLVVGNQVIELAMRPAYRRKEIFALRPLLLSLFEQGFAGYAMPKPSPESKRLFLEGGDVLLADRNLLVGVSGMASDEDGVRWLQRFLGLNYRVHLVRIRPDILHLDLAIALVRPGLAIVDPAALVDGTPALLRGWDLIELKPEEAEALAANVLIIDYKTVVVEENQHRLMDELDRRGVEPLPLAFDVPILMAGGFRCATHPLLRRG